jgi:Flp pilus assembly protein TadB
MQVATASDQPIYYQPVPMEGGSAPQTSSGPLRAYVTVRVPSAKYAAFVADAAKLGTVITESESSDDVTQQHVDMVARLGNLDAEQKRLRQLFAKANTVKDMLAVEQELTRVQGDIESMKAQINYLENQAAMATVTLELSEPKAIAAPAGTDWGVQTALTNSIRAFVNTMNVLIIVLGPVLALLVFVGLPAALIAWFVLRRVKRHRDRVAAASRVEVPAPPAEPDGPPVS